jgi:monoamine oxidase
MSRKPKTPLLSFLQRACRSAIVCEERGISVEEFLDRRFDNRLRQRTLPSPYNRRDFLKTAIGAAVLGGLTLSMPREIKASQTAPSIAIVGGGIAGLNAAYQLGKRGHRATVYEASTADSWGRIQTLRHADNNLTAERGGEFIDTGHADMLQLAKEFGLPLVDTIYDASHNHLIKDSYYFGGRHYSEAEVIRQFRHVARQIKADAGELPESISYDTNSDKARSFDNISIDEYLTKHLPLQGDWLYKLLTVAYTSEFGLEISQQSALNFLTMIGTDVSREFKIYGESDEKYKIVGGNDRLITALTKRLAGQIEKGKELTAIQQMRDGRYTLTFKTGPQATADYVVLALPFSTLRHVDIVKLALKTPKQKAIQELGYGTNSKLLLDVSSRVWRAQGRAGYLFSEEVQNGWDNSIRPHENLGPGGYTVYLGGEAGRKLKEGQVNRYLDTLDGAFHGFKNVSRVAEVVNWSERDFNRASYACYRVGQWTTIAGSEFEPDPNGTLYFCGEHCSRDFQGYMNGGAETGGRVATAISQRLDRASRRMRLRR